MADKVITRFAPSPTGFLHLGSARTALFNWLHARNTGGTFILRIEDTDAARSTQASIDAILEAMEWLNIDWDEGPVFQSKRFPLYTEHVEILLDKGGAYYCNCSPERLDEMRKSAVERGEKPKYDGTCREKGLKKAADTVVRFKAPLTGQTVVRDLIKGEIVFQNEELDDFIIARPDGSPTYNFCVVVDDMTMGVNTVVRGDDHVMNTPKQILLYKAFGRPLPVFGHVPMVLGVDGARLSKRHGAVSVTAYRDMGFLPDALINYLVRLGWSYGNQEFFTRRELIEKFTLDNIGKSAGRFDFDKLVALNAEHIRNTPPETVAEHVIPHLKEQGIDPQDGPDVAGMVKTLAPRCKTLTEMAESARFYFVDEISYDEKGVKKFFKPDLAKPLSEIAEGIEKTPEPLTEAALSPLFMQVLETYGLKFGKIAQPVRLALTGKTVSPGLFEMMEVLGSDRTVARIRTAVEYIQTRT
jgi:glutamyl-tRNA synthetase